MDGGAQLPPGWVWAWCAVPLHAACGGTPPAAGWAPGCWHGPGGAGEAAVAAAGPRAEAGGGAAAGEAPAPAGPCGRVDGGAAEGAQAATGTGARPATGALLGGAGGAVLAQLLAGSAPDGGSGPTERRAEPCPSEGQAGARASGPADGSRGAAGCGPDAGRGEGADDPPEETEAAADTGGGRGEDALPLPGGCEGGGPWEEPRRTARRGSPPARSWRGLGRDGYWAPLAPAPVAREQPHLDGRRHCL